MQNIPMVASYEIDPSSRVVVAVLAIGEANFYAR
jgi:hypothetical protein